MKTSELTGMALDWAVAKCGNAINNHFVTQWEQGHRNYSTDWAQGGPIIEREGIYLARSTLTDDYKWGASIYTEFRQYGEYGPTPLIAAMRCYVASKLGDEVEIPEELSK